MLHVSHWYLMDRFNILIRQSIEHGLVKYFQEKTKMIMNIHGVEESKEVVKYREPFVLLAELKIAFIIYMFGMILALCVFGLEVIRYHLKNIGFFRCGKK